MATGLDRIIEQILADAEAKAAEQVAAAEEEAKKTLADAAAEAEQKANVLLADSEKVGADIKARAASTAEFTRRRTVLAAKQNAIRDVIAAAQKELHDLPDDEYFSVLLKLAQKNALPGDAEMQLNEKDLARMPQDFSAQLKAAVPGTNITVSNTPCNIPDGFLLVYGGIDVSVAQYIADEMGVELQVENMGFDYLLTSLDKGDFDIVLAAMEATPDRLENADFSDPYYTDVPPAILVKADKADQYKTLADFNGKSIGAQTATTKLDMVNEMEGVNPVALQSVLDLVNELVYDKVDAILVDGGVAKQYAEANPDLVIADASAELGEPAPYCVAVQKGDPKGLLPAINAAIAKMNEANMLETFIADADSLADVAVEVSAN